MKKYILLFSVSIVLNLNNLNSQDFQWAKAGIGSGASFIVKDKANNFYTGGYPKISKYDPSGGFVWEVDITNFGLRGMVCDSIGNVYITGGFFGTVTMGAFTLSSSGGSYNNVYLAKINSSGVVQWISRSYNNGSTGADGITIDKLGNPIIIGRFKDSLQLDAFVFDAPMTNQLYLAKYSPSGICMWAKHLKAASFSGGAPGPKIKTDTLGNSYIYGHFHSWAILDSLNLFSHGPYDTDVFLTKFDHNGNFQWAKGIGGSFEELLGNFDIDKSGNTYMGGYFGSTPTYFDGYTLNNTSVDDYFTAKYDFNGNCLWVKYGYSGNIAAADDGYYTNYPSFITKFDGAGTLEWTKTISGSASNAAMVVREDSVFITGSYTGTVGFDSHYLSSSSNQMYIAKLGPPSITTDAEEPNDFSNLSIYPNPSSGQFGFHYSSNGSHEDLSIEIRNILGQLILCKSYKKFTRELTDVLDLSKQTKGIYFLELITETKKETRRIAVN